MIYIVYHNISLCYSSSYKEDITLQILQPLVGTAIIYTFCVLFDIRKDSQVAEGSMMAFHAGDQTSQVLRMEYQRRQKDWSQVVSSENHHNHPEVGLSLEASHLLIKSPVKVNNILVLEHFRWH